MRGNIPPTTTTMNKFALPRITHPIRQPCEPGASQVYQNRCRRDPRSCTYESWLVSCPVAVASPFAVAKVWPFRSSFRVRLLRRACGHSLPRRAFFTRSHSNRPVRAGFASCAHERVGATRAGVSLYLPPRQMPLHEREPRRDFRNDPRR